MFIDLIPHQPCRRIYLTYLITIMMIGSHTATKGKSLVNSIIKHREVVFLWCLVSIAINVIRKTGKHCFNIIPRHLSYLLILFVRSYNRCSRKSRTCCRRADIRSFKCLVSGINLLFRGFFHFQKICQTLLDCFQVFRLSSSQLGCQWSIIRQLLPLPYQAPMPEVTVSQAIISRQLLIRSGTKIHLLFREYQTVKKNTSFALGGN